MWQIRSWASYKFRSMLELIRPGISAFSSSMNTVYHRNSNSSGMPMAKFGYGFPKHQGLQLFGNTTGSKTLTTFGTNMVKDGNKEQVPPPVPPQNNILYWARWVLGSILTLLLPFWKQYWGKLQRIEGKVEMVAEEVESVAEVVEKVAIKAEKVSSEVANVLPDNGKLKETALIVEHISKIAAQDAQLTLDIIHKVDALKHDFEELETLVEPVVDKIVVNHESDGK
ncbi:uncharacterized protein LOC107427618 isoform X1 [Ziziphus jujuba]|uniref:Uncharacterized protein LOC107427618 isoform X1 n=1 Tax=Ziziphus jujuba TaxID=326968 RepID=A0A6P6GHC6_ZIZJJ|nr:uncharacterized protein LOC107427618 isoform X1 [Ziziphus jujuba]